MSAENNDGGVGGLAGINSNRLFLGSCIALIATSVSFGVVTSLMGDLKSVFALSNTEAGWIGGATIWGFTVSIFIFGPLCDAIGMRRLLRFSLLCHIIGPLMMIFANSFWTLFCGGLVIALANGTIEAVCNPLVATIYPDEKTTKLNHFHVWFPGGIVLGGLAAFFIGKMPSIGIDPWRIKLALVLLPSVIYGVIFTGQKFPVTERVQSGLSFGDMVKATLFRPLFIVLFICMSLTASLELGPGRWMGEVMSSVMSKFAGANAGILVLVYGSGLMAILRLCAGPVVHKLSPTGLLVASAILAGLGLFALTHVQAAFLIFIAATIFYVGVCYFWPTMLGVVAERVPKGGALAMALLGGWGMAVVGIITVPAMGRIADTYGHEKIVAKQAIVCIEQGGQLLRDKKETDSGDAIRNIDIAIALVDEVNKDISETQALPKIKTTKALRSIARYVPESEIGKQAGELVKPADDYGGIISFRWVASLSIFLIVVFGIMYQKDRAAGGYKVEKIGESTETSES